MATISTPLRIGPADKGRTMTLEKFLEAEVEEGYRYEPGRGVLNRFLKLCASQPRNRCVPVS